MNILEHSTTVMVPASIQQTFDIPFRPPPEWQERLCFRSNEQSTIRDGPKQRLDAVAIPCGYEEVRAGIV